jgi:hypothetical protein
MKWPFVTRGRYERDIANMSFMLALCKVVIEINRTLNSIEQPKDISNVVPFDRRR